MSPVHFPFSLRLGRGAGKDGKGSTEALRAKAQKKKEPKKKIKPVEAMQYDRQYRHTED